MIGSRPKRMEYLRREYYAKSPRRTCLIELGILGLTINDYSFHVTLHALIFLAKTLHPHRLDLKLLYQALKSCFGGYGSRISLNYGSIVKSIVPMWLTTRGTEVYASPPFPSPEFDNYYHSLAQPYHPTAGEGSSRSSSPADAEDYGTSRRALHRPLENCFESCCSSYVGKQLLEKGTSKGYALDLRLT